jgi:hypothetical protein
MNMKRSYLRNYADDNFTSKQNPPKDIQTASTFLHWRNETFTSVFWSRAWGYPVLHVLDRNQTPCSLINHSLLEGKMICLNEGQTVDQDAHNDSSLVALSSATAECPSGWKTYQALTVNKWSNNIRYREDAKNIRMLGSGAISIDGQRRGTFLADSLAYTGD